MCIDVGSARAADPTEIWPDLSAYYGLGAGTRAYFEASFTKGLESDSSSLNLSAALDVSIKPILRRYLQEQDWQRRRFFWVRFGYAHVGSATNGTRKAPEERGFVAFTARAPLPADFAVEARGRTEFRWIGGEYSTRHRFRLEANREFVAREHTVLPYFNVEWFYDTRYDGWARTLYKVGSEVTVDQQFRYEFYLARQVDHLPQSMGLNAIGLEARWYF